MGFTLIDFELGEIRLGEVDIAVESDSQSGAKLKRVQVALLQIESQANGLCLQC